MIAKAARHIIEKEQNRLIATAAISLFFPTSSQNIPHTIPERYKVSRHKGDVRLLPDNISPAAILQKIQLGTGNEITRSKTAGIIS